jgi:acyl-CoA synthetase (NDP forming)
MAQTPAAGSSGAAAARLMLRPRSIAVIGASARPGSAGHNAFMNLVRGEYSGELYAVGRSGGAIEGHLLLAGVAELPEGVDLAILTLPAAAVHEALIACAARRVKSAVVFAAGFSEIGGAGQAAQQSIGETARTAGMSLLGPNCFGYGNLVDGLNVGFFGGAGPGSRYQGREGLAVIGQSGLLVAHIRSVFEARGLPVSYFVTTGNEAGLTAADFLDFLADDPSTRTVVVYAEQIRAPQAFLAAASRALAAGKAITMLHTGKSEQARIAARSHTGALAGSYTAMRTAVEGAGIAVVDTLEELADVAELLARFGAAPTRGVGVVSFSGAFCGQAHDYCAGLGLDIPPLSPETAEALSPQLPEFVSPANPLDLTTQPAWQPELLGIGVKALLDEPAIGSVVIGTPLGGAAAQSQAYLDGLLPRLRGNKKPVIFGAMTDGRGQPPELLETLAAANLPFIASPERALRAVAVLTGYGRRRARSGRIDPAPSFPGLPVLGAGSQPEWAGKTLLAAIGIAVPRGALARSLEEATAIATRIGYPVVVKAQAAELTHKTEAGGVIIGIGDAEALARAWDQLHANLERARPDITLDGVLIEQQAPKGAELMIGARRDPDWGPLLLAGLGGVWAEALGDIRTMPPALEPEHIVEELHELKGARLLEGFRGAPELDVEAVAMAASRLGRLMLSRPEILEIEVNPLSVGPKGAGATALDALVITVSEDPGGVAPM